MALVKIQEIASAPLASGHIFCSEESTDFVICKSPDKLNALVSAIQPHKTVHYVSDGDWSTHDLVGLLLKRCMPADLFITTYALREFPVRQLILALERNEILSVNMLLDYRARVRTPEVYQLASFNLTKIHLTSIHAKVCVLRGPDVCFTVMGSANWTQNPRIEAGMVSMDKSLAEFHIDWITKAMDNGEVFE